MKKKKGVLVWTSLLAVGLVLVICGFLFGQVAELAGLYSNQESLFAPVTWSTIFDPLNVSFNRLFAFDFSTYLVQQVVLYVVLGLGLIALIAYVVLAIVKRTAKYLPHLILVLLADFIGIYMVCFVWHNYEVFENVSIVRQLSTFNGVFPDVMMFKINIVAGVLAYVMLVGCLLTLVSAIALFILVLSRLSKLERKVKVEAEEEELPVKKEEAPLAINEEKEEPVAPKKKKVVLVVKRYDGFKTPEPVIERPTEYPRQQVEVKPLTREDIRTALKDELDAREREAMHCYCHCKEEEKVEARPVVSEADSAETENEKPLIPTPIIISIPEPVVVPQEQPKVEEKKPSLGKDEIRDIIREELQKVLESLKPEETEEVIEEVHEVVKAEPVEQPKVEEKVAEVEETPEVIDETVEVKEEETAPVQEEVVTLEEVQPEPVQEVKEEVVEELPETQVETPVEQQPMTLEEPVVLETEPAQKIERISFATRVQNADDSLKDAYNQIKSLLMSYGLKSRVSNGGDAFRLHKVNYCKITVAGNSLKLYLALDPADYKNSTLPIKDASSKAVYKDIPLIFKVKSGLSLRRAEQLITEMMDKHGLEQVDRVEVKDYVSELANATEETDESDE